MRCRASGFQLLCFHRCLPVACPCLSATICAEQRATVLSLPLTALPASPPQIPVECRLVTISKEGAQRRLITPEDHPVFWDEIPAPAGMVI